MAVLTPDIAMLDDGLETEVGTRGVKLSGGQVQRAAAARLFLREAEVLDRSPELRQAWSRDGVARG